jgi:hypothetical protein
VHVRELDFDAVWGNSASTTGKVVGKPRQDGFPSKDYPWAGNSSGGFLSLGFSSFPAMLSRRLGAGQQLDARPGAGGLHRDSSGVGKLT